MAVTNFKGIFSGLDSDGRFAGLRRAWLKLGLPAKLLLLTSVFVLVAELLIFLPSMANYRVAWLNERLTAAQLATLASEAFPGGDVPSGLRAELLRTAQVKAVASRREGLRRLVLPVDNQMTIDAHFDLRETDQALSNGNPIRALLEDGLPGRNLVQIGLMPFANTKKMHEDAVAAGAAERPSAYSEPTATKTLAAPVGYEACEIAIDVV